jgi:hypothetical protein
MALAPVAHAQEAAAPSEDEVTARARALFDEGLELADAGDWERAVPRFRRALDLREAAPVRFNLATSLSHMGRLVEAIEELDRILTDPEADAEVREAARELRAELRPRLGRLTVTVRGDAEGTHVVVDGRPWDALGIAAVADPGVRVVRLLRAMQELDVEEADVPEGGATRVILEVPAPAASTEPVASAEDGGSDDAWIWGVVTGVILVVAGAAAVTTAVLLEQGPNATAGDFMPPRIEVGL